MARPDTRMPPDRLAAMTDEELVALYADEDIPTGQRHAAFHALVDRYQRRLFAVCVRVLRSPQDAEDAVQETFVRLARNAVGFRGDAKVSTWLYRIARNVCTDRVRYDARRPSVPVEDVAEAAGDRAGDDHIAARETALALESALARLDDQSRSLLLMVAVDGLTYEEAAELTGSAVGTVKSRVSRARVKLGELLSASSPASPPTASGVGPPVTQDVSGTASPRGPPDPRATSNDDPTSY